jgi:dienelactone hydrolase
MRKRSGTFFGVVLSFVLTVLIGVDPAHVQTTSTSTVDVTFPDTAGKLQLTGHLYRPDGPGPFPAVVALHGCGGIGPNLHRWAQTLQQWGYVALLVDSFSPRGKTNICDSTLSVDPQYARMPDAYAAKSYLARQPFVDGNRVAVMGWSHGGSTTLYAVDNIYLDRLSSAPFKAAIAFYPGCDTRLLRVNAPLLILMGEDDDWTLASRCKDMVSQSEQWGGKPADGVTLQVYPGAHHGFDSLVPPRSCYGHMVGGHPEAAAQAAEEVKRFLAQHLGMKPQTP